MVMVGIFSRFSGLIRPHPFFPLEEETQVTKRFDFDSDSEEQNVNFQPIEHPPEPAEDDGPVKCPLPDSYVFNEQFGGGSRKRSEQLIANEEGLVAEEQPPPPAQAARKRHHPNPRNRAAPRLLKGPSSSNVFQIFQQCKFEF